MPILHYLIKGFGLLWLIPLDLCGLRNFWYSFYFMPVMYRSSHEVLKAAKEVHCMKQKTSFQELPEGLISIADMASLLGVSQRWLRLRIERGEVPYYRHTGIIRFDPREILNLLRHETRNAYSENVSCAP